jgi:hypothetical protein
MKMAQTNFRAGDMNPKAAEPAKKKPAPKPEAAPVVEAAVKAPVEDKAYKNKKA